MADANSSSTSPSSNGERPRPNLATLARRTNYALGQAARVAWYSGQSLATRRAATRIAKQTNIEPPKIERPEGGIPNERQLLAEVRKLFATDLANVEAGLYPAPASRQSAPDMLRDARKFFADLPAQQMRRLEGDHQQPFTQENREKLPRYYLQNFHFQNDGWLSEESAEVYDTQVEVLFYGAAACMRRQGLVPLANELKGRDQRTIRYADIATGPGSFVDDVKDAYPRLPALAVDLSEPYLNHAKRRLAHRSKVQPLVAMAEQLPFANASLDVASTVFLFHELPMKVRRQVISEFARVVKPGGLVIFVDSLQTGDVENLDGLLTLFPQMFHEPYYNNYLADDVDGAFAEAGLEREYFASAFVSRVAAYRRSA
ncbi:MAG: class I SAM-dependent methyltransferase [Pseudomonadota bacterium]